MALNEKIITQARHYATECHEAVNHKYGDKPYRHHLHTVFLLAKTFRNLIPEKHHNIVLSAAWCHDIIRDTRQTYFDVRKATNLLTAEIVHAVTPEKGKTRAERYSPKYYQTVRSELYADYIVICDRLAETIFSKKTEDNMFRVYQAEHSYFKAMLYQDKYKPLFDYFERVFNTNGQSSFLIT